MPKRIHLAEVDSTNSYIKTIIHQAEITDILIVSADFQTGGRGQKGNSWESERGKNLTFSTLLQPNFILAHQQFIISQIISLAVRDTLSLYTEDISIKWPNDIYWKDKKICGILIENSLMGEHILQSIIGIGINVNQSEFESDAPNPISLYQITKKTHDLDEILTTISNKISVYYQLAAEGNTSDIVSSYKKALFRKDGFYTYNDGIEDFEAKIKDIEPYGLLVLETINGEIKKFAFKEVKYIL